MNHTESATPAMPRRWLVLVLLSLAMLPIAIDATILYMAVPSLSIGLQPSARQLLWILDIYSLLLAGLVIASGPIGDRLGHKTVLLLGLGLFGLASLAAGLAPSPALLIAARGLLACGGAMIVPATLAIIRQIFTDPAERSVAIGIWGGIASGGTALGPIVGGVVLEHFWWGAVFLINLPVVAVLLPLLMRYLGAVSAAPSAVAVTAPAMRRQFGEILIGIAGVIALAYALKALATAPNWPDAGLGVMGLGLLSYFARLQWREAKPLLDLRLFRSRYFVAGNLAAFLPFMALAGFELALAQQLQSVMGLSPLDAAWFLLPMPVAALVMGPLGGRLAGLFGMRPVLVAALLMAGGGYLVLGGFDLITWPVVPILLLAAIGGGQGVVMMAASDTIMTGAPPERAGSAASIESVAFELGTGFGIAIFGSLATFVFLQQMALIGIDPAPLGSVSEALHLAAGMEAPAGDILAAGAKLAFTAAFDRCALAAGGVMLASVPLFLWLLRR